MSILFCAAMSAVGAENKNLVKNGNFEKGSGRIPTGWGSLDNITSKWSQDGGNPGKCLLLDTAVLQKDKKSFKENEEAFKGPGKGGQYETVGAHEGAWAYAAPIDLKPGDTSFIVTCDVKGPAKSNELMYPILLIRGYNKITEKNAGQDTTWFHTFHEGGPAYSEMFGSDELNRPSKAGDYLMVYRHSLNCRLSEPGKWEHFEMGFTLPKMKKFIPQRILLKPYAFWPSGKYYFDNITFRVATPEEVKAVNAKRKSINEFQ